MYGYGKGVKTDKVYAHMWWNIAASAEIEDAKKNRDLVEKNMNLAEIEKAQDLARECTKRNYKGCRSLVYEFEDDWIRERPGLPSRYNSRNFERRRWVHYLSTISDFSGLPASNPLSAFRLRPAPRGSAPSARYAPPSPRALRPCPPARTASAGSAASGR